MRCDEADLHCISLVFSLFLLLHVSSNISNSDFMTLLPKSFSCVICFKWVIWGLLVIYRQNSENLKLGLELGPSTYSLLVLEQQVTKSIGEWYVISLSFIICKIITKSTR